MRIKLRDKYFNLRYTGVRDKNAWGECDPPDKENKEILISNKIKDPKLLLNILIHEMLHGCLWDLDEEAIKETANSLSEVLYKLGAKIRIED